MQSSPQRTDPDIFVRIFCQCPYIVIDQRVTVSLTGPVMDKAVSIIAIQSAPESTSPHSAATVPKKADYDITRDRAGICRMRKNIRSSVTLFQRINPRSLVPTHTISPPPSSTQLMSPTSAMPNLKTLSL